MISLVIETCTERGVIAFLEGLTLIYEKNLPYGYQNSQHLLPEIHKAFQKASLSPKQLDFITVGIGPGSYTGIRVGVMVAKALAYALKIPLVGVSSLEGFVPSQETTYASVIDAKIGGVYWQSASFLNGEICLSSEPQISPIEDLQKHLSTVCMLVSPHSQLVKEKVEKRFPNQWQWEEKGPDSIQLTKTALEKMKNNDFCLDERLELLYLRKTQAEIERGK